ncbi:TerB family tellurite resistance protein [Urechidicola vernalis]|uniref:TerB family tellurite resistance protein n=1 Tax=Urechidicola vernalis TaxID=3075600 RepID=A0ABU2Y832_9FLAO|nr:TerB family tellurite resistance protein [Urechidicola sp. P050]MDT0554187.1 TerB family tellurite resistance protein [Urechidicola sp. P050]
MSISDLYSSGIHKRELGHFANIVKMAQSDNIVTNEEQALIERMKRRLNITDSEYVKVIENPQDYPMVPPLDYKNRIEHLYNLVKMVFADSEVTDDQVGLLNKITIGLGFSKENYQEITKVAIEQFMTNTELKDFRTAIKAVN